MEYSQTVMPFAGRMIALSHFCSACNEAGRIRETTARTRTLKSKWVSIVGEELARTVITHPGIARWVVAACDKWANAAPDALNHLGLVGPSGIGKTRCLASICAPRAIVLGIGLRLLPASDMRDLSAMSHEIRSAAEDRMIAAMHAPLLILDDLGKEGDARVSPATAAGMWRLVDHRYRTGKPMLWTANGTPEDIAVAYPPEYAEKLRRRLLEMGPVDRAGHLPRS